MSNHYDELPSPAIPRWPLAIVVTWLASSVMLWTLTWLVINAAGSRVWLILPVLFLATLATSTVWLGKFLTTLGHRRRLMRLAVTATGVLSAWSLVGVLIAMMATGESWSQMIAVIFFGSFIAVFLAILGFFSIALLLWFGAFLTLRQGGRRHGSRRASLGERPIKRTPVR